MSQLRFNELSNSDRNICCVPSSSRIPTIVAAINREQLRCELSRAKTKRRFAIALWVVVALPVVGVACDVGTPSQKHGLTRSADKASGAQELVLNLIRRVPTGSHVIPRALVASSDNSVWVLFDSEQRISQLRSTGSRIELGVAADTGFQLLASLADTLFATRQDGIYRYDASHSRFIREYKHDKADGAISSFAADRLHFWMVLWKGRNAQLIRVARIPNRNFNSLVKVVTPLVDAATVQRQWDGNVAVAYLREPYTLAIYDRTSTLRWSAPPVDVALAESDRMKLPKSAASMAVLILDHRRMLQVFTDLRGSARWLAIYSDSAMNVERSRRIDSPVGFVEALAEKRLLWGFVETEAGGEIVLFQWEWQ